MTDEPEKLKILFNLGKFYCNKNQDAEWHFKCGDEEVVFTGKELFEILVDLRNKYDKDNSPASYED